MDMPGFRSARRINPARCSIWNCPWPMSPKATAQWTSAARSRPSFGS